MPQYALIQNGIVHEFFQLNRSLCSASRAKAAVLDDDGGVISDAVEAVAAETVNEALGLAPGLDVRAVTDDVEIGWVAAEDGFSAALPTPAPDAVRLRAQVALGASDRAFLRATEAGLDWPEEWRSYRVALRIIVGSGELPDTGFPERPAYPEEAK